VEIEEFPLALEERDGWLYERISPNGKPVRVVTRINEGRFDEFWLDKLLNR
jgi:hypothetical protein